LKTGELLKEYYMGSRRACARIMSLVENETREGIELLKEIYPKRKNSFRIGITGPPGVGKSTTVNALIDVLKSMDYRLGIIAVDPSSPFTGGAFLGDRLRMQNSYNHEDVFIRSVASRGSLGGLSSSTENIAEIMEGFGMDIILIETVGVGQSELDIMEITDSVAVLLVPESGDSIQAMKSGIMEIGDVFAVNKSDREGADRAVRHIKTILEMKKTGERVPPVVKISAKNSDNIEALAEEIFSHRDYMEEHDILSSKRKMRKLREVKGLLRDMFIKSIDKHLKDVENSEESPYETAQKIFRKINKKEMEDIWQVR